MGQGHTCPRLVARRGGDGVIYEYSSDIYYDSSINIFFFLNEQGEEVECNEQGVEVTA